MAVESCLRPRVQPSGGLPLPPPRGHAGTAGCGTEGHTATRPSPAGPSPAAAPAPLPFRCSGSAHPPSFRSSAEMGIFKEPKCSHFRQFLWSERSSTWAGRLTQTARCTGLSRAEEETRGGLRETRPSGGSEGARFPAHCYGRKKTGCPWPLGQQSPLGDVVRGPLVSEDTQVSASGLHTHACSRARVSSGGSFAGARLVRTQHSDSRGGWAPCTLRPSAAF